MLTRRRSDKRRKQGRVELAINAETARMLDLTVPPTLLARADEVIELNTNMKRREFIALIGGAAAGWPLATRAQQGERMRRIGVLIAGLSEKDSEGQLGMAAFRQGLQNLGWVEGRNIHIEERWPGGNNERLRSFAAELVGMRPDAIFAGNEAATMALQRTASAVPTVFAQVSDPVAAGLVASVARPGGTVTGVALWEYGFATKWGEVLKEIAPRTVRIGVIYDPANAMQRQLPDLERSLSPGVQAITLPVSSRSDLENAIERIAAEPNGALIVFAGPLAVAHRDLIITLAVKYRLPLLYPYRYFTAAGGLISYGPDLVDQYRVVASYIDRILKGEKPADLPVQFPTKYMLVINLKTAKALGLPMPDKLLALADEVIE